MTQISDSEALGTTTKRLDRSGSERVWAGLPKPVSAEKYLHRDIVALIPRLKRYARVLTRDITTADDLVQDCLAHALAKMHLWEAGTDLRAWLFTILYRRYISHIRREARRDRVESRDSHLSSVLPPNQTARLELRDLERALAKLPKEQRSLILLVGLEGMGYAEAATVLDSPVGTVRSRVARGRESLRKSTGLFPGRHSQRPEEAAHLASCQRSKRRRKDFPPVPTVPSQAPKSLEVVQ